MVGGGGPGVCHRREMDGFTGKATARPPVFGPLPSGDSALESIPWMLRPPCASYGITSLHKQKHGLAIGNTRCCRLLSHF